MADIKFEIVKKIGVLSKSNKGWGKGPTPNPSLKGGENDSPLLPPFPPAPMFFSSKIPPVGLAGGSGKGPVEDPARRLGGRDRSMPAKSLITQQSVSSAKLQRAIEMRHEMTPSEGKLWARLRAGRLDGIHFRRQQIIEP